jgi:hypothetical protein
VLRWSTAARIRLRAGRPCHSAGKGREPDASKQSLPSAHRRIRVQAEAGIGGRHRRILAWREVDPSWVVSTARPEHCWNVPRFGPRAVTVPACRGPDRLIPCRPQ